jgi:hypothetical protein
MKIYPYASFSFIIVMVKLGSVYGNMAFYVIEYTYSNF